MAKHVVVVREGTKRHKIASRRLTFVGKYKHGGSVFSDLGLASNWRAYQRDLRAEGLPS